MAIIISVILLFLGIGALIFIHICVVARTFGRGFGHGNENENENGNGNGNRNGMMMGDQRSSSSSMSRDDVEKLPCYDYISKSKGGENGGGGSSPVECAVCLDNFMKGDKCRLLPLCRHSFHAKCVDGWLLKNPNCPICRSTANSGRFSDAAAAAAVVVGVEQPTTQSSSQQLNDDDDDDADVRIIESSHVQLAFESGRSIH